MNLFLVAAAIIAWIYGATFFALGILFVSALLTVWYIRQIGGKETRQIAKEISSNEGDIELISLAVAFFLVSPMILFPVDITQNGAVVNILSHYLGLVLGYFGPAIYLVYR